MLRRQPGSRIRVVDVIESVAVFGIKLGLVAFVVVLAYLIYGLAAGKALTHAPGLTHADRWRIYSNMMLACTALGFSGGVLAVCIAMRFYAEEMLGYGMSLLGVVLYIGTPFAMAVSYSAADIKANQIIGMVVAESRVLAMETIFIGTLLIIIDIFRRIRQVKVARLKQAEKNKYKDFIVGDVDEKDKPGSPGMYARCWQMSFCTGFVRKFCPAYETHKSCWRVKCGCMCDEKTILRALMSKKEAGDKENLKKEIQLREMKSNAPELSGAQKRQRCRNCTIYQFHQHQKYQLVSPVAIVLTLGLIYGFFPTLRGWFETGVKYTDVFISKVSFLPQNGQPIPATQNMPETVFWLFILWLTLVALSYSLKFVEYCIFKLQI